MQANNNGELQPTGRLKLCTHADNLAFGDTASSKHTRQDFDPGRYRWAPHGCGGAPNVDAPGSNYKFY